MTNGSGKDHAQQKPASSAKLQPTAKQEKKESKQPAKSR
jgi:hypothetical protein